MTNYISLSEVLQIHEKLINSFGGSTGIRDMGLLQSAIHRPEATFGGVDLYTSIYLKSAALLESLILNHPFFDGNKRTAISSTAYFLKKNSIVLRLPRNESIAYILDINNHKLSFKQIKEWIQKYSAT